MIISAEHVYMPFHHRDPITWERIHGVNTYSWYRDWGVDLLIDPHIRLTNCFARMISSMVSSKPYKKLRFSTFPTSMDQEVLARVLERLRRLPYSEREVAIRCLAPEFNKR